MGLVTRNLKPLLKLNSKPLLPGCGPGILIVLCFRALCDQKANIYLLLADMWCGHQLLDEVVQTHLSLLDEGCR